MPALFGGIREAVPDTMPDLASAGPGERLAGRPADQELHFCGRHELGDFRYVIRLAEVPVQGQAAEMMPVRLNRLGITVGRQDHAVPGSLKSEAQPAGAAEEVRCQASATSPETGCVCEKGLLIRACLLVRGKTDERSPYELHAVLALPGLRLRLIPHAALHQSDIGRLTAATDKIPPRNTRVRQPHSRPGAAAAAFDQEGRRLTSDPRRYRTTLPPLPRPAMRSYGIGTGQPDAAHRTVREGAQRPYTDRASLPRLYSGRMLRASEM